MAKHETYTGTSFADVDHIVNADGNYLFCRYWKPEREITALVFFVHGYAEHCGRYKEIAEKLMDIGVFSFSHDHICHGESEGYRCHVQDYKILVRDIWQHIDLIKPKYPDLPIFIYGHSMGGALSLFAAHERPTFFRGVLLSAPYITPSPDTATPFKLFMVKAFSYLAPKLRIAKLDPDYLSRSKEQIDNYMGDQLNDNQGMRAAFAMQFLVMTDELKQIIPTTDFSMFVAHSENDKICNVGGAKLLVEVSNSKDMTFKLYKDCHHMLEHETPEFVEAYFAEVVQWIKDRI